MLIPNVEALKKRGIYKIVSESKPIEGLRIENGNLYYKDIILDEKANAPELNVKPMDTFFIYGFGLGNALESIKEKYPKNVIVVLERDPYVMKLALENKDMHKIIEDEKVLYAFIQEGEEKQTIETLIKLLSVRLNWGEVIEIASSNYQKAEFFNFEKLKEIVEKEILPIKLNKNTMLIKSREITENAIRNIPDMLKGNSIAELENTFKDKPTIIIASGPSLMKNIELVKKLQDKACIIAIDSVLPTVFKYNIKPDFICGVDYSYLNENKYYPLLQQEKKSSIVFVSSDGIFYSIPKIFNVSFFLLSTGLSFSGLYRDLLKKMNKKTFSLNAVTHLALNLSYILGSDPVIFVGQDWAYSGGMDHADGASVEVMLPKNVMWIKGNYEEKVPTDSVLLSGLKLVENIIKETSKENIEYINATEGGAYIEGTKVMKLSEVAEKYLKNPLDKNTIKAKSFKNENISERYKEFIHKTESIKNRLAEIIKKSSKALNMNYKVLKKWEKNHNVNEIRKEVDKINKINDEITFDEVFNRAVSNFFFKEFYLFNQEEFDISDHDTTKRIEQSIKYFKLIKEKTAQAKKYVDQLFDYLYLNKEYSENKNKFISDIDKVIKLCSLHFEFKNIYDALDLIKPSLKKYPNNPYLYYWMAKIQGLNRFLHKQSLENYKKAIELDPNFKKAKFDYEVEKNMVTSHLILAKKSVERKNYVEAKRLVNRALEYEPDNENVKKWIKVIDEMAKMAKNARKQEILFDQLKLDNDIFEEYKKAIEFVRQNKAEEAHDHLLKLYEKYGAFGDIPFLLGSIYIDRKELNKAEKYLKEAVELIPYQPLVYLALGKLYIEKEEYALAKENLEKAISMNPNLKPGVLDVLGNLYYEFGEYEKAFRAFEEYLQYSDNKIKTLTKLALCYKEMGMMEEYNRLMDRIRTITNSN